MHVDDLLRTLRNRWPSIAVITVVAVVAAWVLLPDKLPDGDRRPGARATATLVVDTGSTPAANKANANQLNTLKVIASGGEVPAQVAAALGTTVPKLRAQVAITTSAAENSLTIVAVHRTMDGAAKVADTYSTKLLAVLAEQAEATQATTRDALNEQIDKLEAEKALLDLTAAADPGAKAGAEAISRQLNTYRTRLAVLNGTPPRPPLRSIGPPTVQRLNTAQGADRFLRLPVRLGLAGLLGFVVALAGLSLIDRFDVRLRTKQAAELAYGLPVLAEVPPLPSKRPSSVLLASEPNGAYAEAHRILRTSVLRADPASGNRPPAERTSSCLIVVTSADPSEGKTSTAANLAASFAEAGSETLLAGLDLRHRDLQTVVAPSGDAEEVRLPIERNAGSVRVSVSPTVVPNLRLVTVEPPFGPPAIVLPVVASWLRGLKDEVGTIVVDTPPLLVCNDASEVIPYADTVLVACRAGFTTIEATERAAEILARLHAPVCGVVLVGAELRAPVQKVAAYGAATWTTADGSSGGGSGPGGWTAMEPATLPPTPVAAAEDEPGPETWRPPAPLPDGGEEAEDPAAAREGLPPSEHPEATQPERPEHLIPSSEPSATPSKPSPEAGWRPVPVPVGSGPTAVRRTLERTLGRITSRRKRRP